jgi:hypothetical protein
LQVLINSAGKHPQKEKKEHETAVTAHNTAGKFIPALFLS